jgi:hypothetical protein
MVKCLTIFYLLVLLIIEYCFLNIILLPAPESPLRGDKGGGLLRFYTLCRICHCCFYCSQTQYR